MAGYGLRIILLLGMAAHKLVWELMKRKGGVKPQGKKSIALNFKSIIKLGKSLFLLFLVLQTLYPGEILPIAEDATAIRLVGLAIYSLGLLTAIIGRVQLGDNWVDLEDFTVLPGQDLVKTGLYRYIRHPIYIGDALLVIGLQLALNSWLVIIGLALLPIIYKQALDEENILSRSFPEYRNYQKQTKMFVPYLV